MASVQVWLGDSDHSIVEYPGLLFDEENGAGANIPFPSTVRVTAASLKAALAQVSAEGPNDERSLGSIASLDLVVSSVSKLSAAMTPLDLASWKALLQKDKAMVRIHVLHVLDADDPANESDPSTWPTPISTAFLLAGLVPVSCTTEEVRRPDVEKGEGRVYSARVAPPTEAASLAAAPLRKKTFASTSVVRIQLDEDQDGGLVDEDDLMQDADRLLAPPPNLSSATKTAADDCAGREPCDNCTCGRSSTSNGTTTDATTSKSSCGKCHLGDAFRCASCPYLGEPAFKPGEEHLILDLQDDL